MNQSAPVATVLYVEDHEVNALLMQAVFERRPQLRLVVATTAAQALQVAATLQPMLLLLDLNLPDGHGAQLLPQLRLLPGCGTAPAVAVTADQQFDIAGTGFIELWPKPLDLAVVFRRLDELTVGQMARPSPPTRTLRTRLRFQAQPLPIW